MRGTTWWTPLAPGCTSGHSPRRRSRKASSGRSARIADAGTSRGRCPAWPSLARRSSVGGSSPSGRVCVPCHRGARTRPVPITDPARPANCCETGSHATASVRSHVARRTGIDHQGADGPRVPARAPVVGRTVAGRPARAAPHPAARPGRRSDPLARGTAATGGNISGYVTARRGRI